VAKRKCGHCSRWFVPDLRVGKRQKSCSIGCQKLRKRENNRLYRERNPKCWEGHYEYVKQWRQKKKEKRRRTLREIQAERLRKAIEYIMDMDMFSPGNFSRALPDGLSILDHSLPFFYIPQGKFMTHRDF
jgi:hypothetical protein